MGMSVFMFVRINLQLSESIAESGYLIQLCHVWRRIGRAKRGEKREKVGIRSCCDKWMTLRMACPQRAASEPRAAGRNNRWPRPFTHHLLRYIE